MRIDVVLEAITARHEQERRNTDSLPRVVHISGDFPDSVEPNKTPVIRSLLEMTSNSFTHEVISLNRRNPGAARFLVTLAQGLGRPRLAICRTAFEQGAALRYDAPARGLFHATMLDQLGDAIADLIANDQRPALIVGHKLSVEGLVAKRVADRLGIPFAISLQGNTDTKIVAARPDLKRRFARVFHEASVVFPFAPWALRAIEVRLGVRRGATMMLPCATELDQPLAPQAGDGSLVSAFHLRNWKIKNLGTLARALRHVGSATRPVPLAIIGGGSAQDELACRSLVKGVQDVTFEGHLDHAALPRRLNRASGFVLPSRRESFGLVFIEALFAGLPIIYPSGAAVDGYFDGAPFALRVDARDSASISAAFSHLLTHEMDIKDELARWQVSPQATAFTRAAIASTFAAGLGLNECVP